MTNNPKEHLDLRLAKGEISKEEYLEIRDLIDSSSINPNEPAPIDSHPVDRSPLHYLVDISDTQKLVSPSMNCTGFIVCQLVSSLFFFVFGWRLEGAGHYISRSEQGDVYTPLVLAILFAVASGVIVLRLLFMGWKSIQNTEHARTTPGKAVGYLFIPIFNLYWIWVAYQGLVTDLNKALSDHYTKNQFPESSKSYIPDALGILICICFCLSFIPVVNICAGILQIIFVSLFICYVATAINDMSVNTINSIETNVEDKSDILTK